MKKVNSFIVTFLVLLIIGQILVKPKKKVLVIGHTGAGKSTFCNFLHSSYMFQVDDFVNQRFQTEQLELKDYTLFVTNTPGFANINIQNNSNILSDIAEFVKKEQVDFVVIVINYSIRASNEEYILKWLHYTLPLNKQNSLIIVNYYRDILSFCQHGDEDECPQNHQIDPQQNQSEENNQNFINFIRNTFTNSTIEKINYNTSFDLTEKEFQILIKKLKQEYLPLAQLDHTKVQDLQYKIETELQKNESFCMKKFKMPEEEKYLRKMTKLEQELIQLKAKQKALQNLVNSIDLDISYIQNNPNSMIDTGNLFLKDNQRFQQINQINKINRLHDDKYNIRFQMLSQRMIEYKIKEKLEKLEEDSESLLQKIPYKEFKQCLHSGYDYIQEMMEVKNYFEELNSLSQQKQYQQ
ncbi:50S ribosome-binding GTPase (macronuclear) [Tetrahymena thermophila SB210]|uniref:50S ribosome-binding GTPase n=1 Tax=Tetrahymena thermophila (strain SB210) TaxID=312017 RepID=Q23LQ3_TETTS|nr:50S ribosome-binding GTPase [Tetrahymena thermophila SB210]EAR97457.1 50S ribosome-binding GTPase [Tetrahymena thermophila SB210]|eukprot:XP_001017702.1 50S ribosome-binding GTPase [Tetrahymena thermophila SB210]